jgi:hypothetical protein
MALIKIKKKIKRISSCHCVYADTHSYRLLPYSIVFDLLNYFKDADLNQRVCTALRETLPHREGCASDVDLWIELDAIGNITVIVAKVLAIILADYVRTLSKPIAIRITSQVKMTCENEIFLYFFQEFYPRVEIVLGAVNEGLSPLDDAYLQWQCFVGLKSDDYTKNFESILRHAWNCAELGAEEVAFRIMETGIAKARIFYIKQIYLLQLQLMRIATQHYISAADEAREVTEDYEGIAPAFYLTKAWGCMLTRRVESAWQYFELAHVDIQTLPLDLESLHRLNIFALLQHVIDNYFSR